MKNTRALTTVKSKKGQQLNQREVSLIRDGKIKGVLWFDIQMKQQRVILNYNAEGLVPLNDFLKINSMNKRLFVIILRNLVLMLKEIEDNRFSKDLLMWSLQAAYVEPSTWHTYMMYVPLQPFETSGDLKSFLLEMISQCSFEPGEDIEYVQTLVQELNGVTAYTAGMLELYCDRASEELLRQKRESHNRKTCPVCGSKLAESEEMCPFCGKRILPRAFKPSQKEDKLIDSGFISAAEQPETGTEKSNLRRSAISVNEDENGVVTVFRGARRIVQSVWLEDCSKAGKIYITKFPFRIGKMEGVTDHRICNNAVSRKHADILKEQGQYYIIDLDSTNGTYLNGKRIQPGVKELLTDGMIVEFANYRYKIHID